ISGAKGALPFEYVSRFIAGDLDPNDAGLPYEWRIPPEKQGNYGPSLQEILKSIKDISDKEGRSRDVSAEDIQKIKDRVRQVGSLEFRILANNVDDGAEVLAAAQRAVTQAGAVELDRLAKRGDTPPNPEGIFSVRLARGQQGEFTYSWVELGRQE